MCMTSSDHVRRCYMRWASARGMNNMALRAIFRSTVVVKLLCLVWFHQDVRCVWMRSYTVARNTATVCRTYRHSRNEQCDSMDQKLFDNINMLANQDHLLSALLPPPSQNYNLSTRPYSQELPQHTRCLIDYHFITRILYKNTTRLLYLLLTFLWQ
jgi:hypothetical protein